MTPDDDFKRLREIAQGSRLTRVLMSGWAAIDAAWVHSALGRAAARLRARAGSLSATQRVRLVALTLAWAGGGHLLFVWFGPRYVTTGLPLWWIAAGVAMAGLVAAAADAVTRAWHESALVRLILTPAPRS